MNKWLFNDTLARKPDRLLGVRKRKRKIDTFNPKFGLVFITFQICQNVNPLPTKVF